MTDAVHFDAEWLALREPCDARSRNTGLRDRVTRGGFGSVVDLGAGTGAHYRHLAPRMPGSRWRLVDHDASLLSRVRLSGPPFETLRASLDRELDALVAGAELVTGSALLDLVPGPFLEVLLRAPAALYFTLTIDERVRLAPAHPEDKRVLRAVWAHHRQPKVMPLAGPALGPDATRMLVRRAREVGREVDVATSDWVLGLADAPLARLYVQGLARAAREQGCESASLWLEARLRAIEQGATLRVGHQDIYVAAASDRSQS